MNLDELAKKYGGSQAQSDTSELDELAKKYGGSAFQQETPVAPVEPAADSGFFRQALDVPVGVVRGAVQGVRMVADAFGAGSSASNAIRGVEDYIGGLMSAQSKQDGEEIARIMQEAEDKGVGAQLKAALSAFMTAPVDLISQGLGTAAPVILAGLGSKVLGAGTLAVRGVQLGAGLTMGAGVTKGVIYEEVKQALEEADVPEEQAEARAQLAQSYGGENLDMILAGTALGGLGAVTGIEKPIAAALARRIMGKAAATEAAEKVAQEGVETAAKQGIARRYSTAMAAEGLPEFAQGSQEQLAANIALQREGFDVDTMRGVVGAGALEGLVGSGLGAGVQAVTGGERPSTPAVSETATALDRERDEFARGLGPEQQLPPGVAPAELDTGLDADIDADIDATPSVEPPVELPGGFTVARRELSRQDVPEAFGIFQEGAETPLTTVATPQDAQRKLESLTQIRQEEQKRLSDDSDKITNGILAEQRKLEVMEATGQTGTDQYVQAKTALEQKEIEAEEKLTDINNKISSYSTPLAVAPVGTRTEVQNEFIVNRGDEQIGVFPSLEAAETTLRDIAPEPFKQADVATRTQDIEAVLKPAFAKFNLGNVGLNVVEAIKTDGGQTADGSYARNLIQIAMDAPEPLKTMRHETVHALKELEFFTPQQWKALTERAEKQWIKEYLQDQTAEVEVDGQMQQMSRLDAYKRMGLSQESIVEEAISDAFAAYDRGVAPPPGMIAALYRKLKNFFTNFGQAIRGAGFESADDIFQRVERGELKSKAQKKEAKPISKVEETEEATKAEEGKAPTKPAKKEKLSLAGAGAPMSTRKLMEQQTPISQQDLGLNTEAGRSGTNNVRDIAKALNQQTLDQFGAMKRKKLTQDESTRISEAIADEVAYQLQTSAKTGTGLGWYSNNYPNAVKRLGKRFPELSTSKYARSVFSALVAVTSNGERVTKNIDNAIKLYADLRKGKRLVVMGNRRATALENNLQVIQDLMAEHGENFEKVLLQEITVSEMNARLRKMGKKADGSYLANTVVPAAAVYFGPKLGAFYANLSGSEGYLTMDLWWTRSINRMRGLLIPKATSASISKFRDMMESPNATRDEVVAATIPLRNKYEEYGWNSELEHLTGAKEPSTKDAKPAWFKKAEESAGNAYDQLLFEHNLEKMANTIYKNEFEMLEEAPFTATDRKFMYDAARKAQTLLRKNGVDLSLADIQAALWYYEKRLYAKLSGRKSDDIGYEEAIIAQTNQGSGRARPSVVFDKRVDRGDDSQGEVSGTEAVRAEPDKDAKLSIRKGIIAEVAPNPDQVLAESWRQMTDVERLNSTKAVANKVMSSVFSELGLKGYEYSFSTGTYEGEVNPNIIVKAPKEATEQELDELGRVLGYALDQKAMVVFDEDNKTSGSQAGFVKVNIPDEMTADQFEELRQHIAQAVPQADGDTLRDGALLYGNFSAFNDNVDTLSDAQYHKDIIKAVESFPYSGVIDVSKPETFHSSLIWPDTRSDYLKETRYGDSSRVQGEAGADVRGQGSRRLQTISEEGLALRNRWIDGRGAARLGNRERGNAVDFGKPTAEYGTPRQGAVSAVGVHFSAKQRPELLSQFYGTGLRGLEGERLSEKSNSDIRDRVYFYVDNGKGVRPESGVGGVAHVIRLNNLYDMKADPLEIVKNSKGETEAARASKRERDIQRAGFDGYLVRNENASQDYALLVGKHVVKTNKLSLRTNFPSVKAVKEAVAKTKAPTTPEFKRFIAGNQWSDADGKPTVFYHATAREFFEFTPSGQSKAIFLATTPEEAETFGSIAEDRLRREIYRAINKDEKLSFFQGVVDAQVKKGTITAKQGDEFIRKAKRKAPEYGDFGDIEQETYDALMDLSPTKMSIMPLYARAETPFEFENPDHVERVMQWVANNTEYPQDFPDKWLSGLKGRIKQGLWQAIEDKRVQLALRTLGFDSFTVRENRNSPKNYAVYQPEQVKSVTGNLGEYDRKAKDTRYSLPSIPTEIDDRVKATTFKRVEKGFARRIVEAISPASAAQFRASSINSYNQMSVYDQKRAEKQGGAVLLADQSAESAALMSDVAAGVAASALGTGNRTGGIPVLRNGITTIDSSVKGVVASIIPLAAYGDPMVMQRYQYWAMVKRGVRLNDQGKNVGITSADVAFAKTLQEKYPEFVTVQKDLIAFNNGLVQYMVDTGVLSKERGAEYVKHADYVPFYRQIDGDKTVGPNLFSSMSSVKPPKKLKGLAEGQDASEAPLADFLETIVRNTTSAIQAGAKNYAAQRTINVVTQVTAPGMGATRLKNAVEKIVPGGNIINVLEKGKTVSYETPDELLIYAMSSLNQTDLPFLSIVSAPANLLRNMVTRDPGFMIANLLRDSLSAYVTSGKDMTPIVDTVIAVGKALGDIDPTTRKLLDAGVISGYDSGNIEESGISLEKDLAKKAGKRKDAVILRPFKSLWDALEKGTVASDAATRAVIYDRVLAETGNEAEALFRSLEVMNFHRKGGSTLIRVLTAAIPFFNARLQGLDLFYRASTGNMNTSDAAAIQRKFFVRGMTMMALSAAYYFMVSDDEEYKNQEQETRDNNWLFPALGIRIPIPFEVGVLFKVVPERIAAYAFGDDTGQDLKDAVLRNAVATFAFNPIPQTVKPVLEAAFDFNSFTWRPIISEGMKDVDPQFQVGPGTSSVAQGIGKALGLSPMKVDHVIKGYTGTMGMYGIDVIDAITNTFSDTPKATKRFEQMPVIKRFVVDKDARGSVTEYYKLKDSVDSVVRTLNLLEKTGESEAYVEYLKKNKGTLAFRDYIRSTERTMRDLRAARVAIRSSAMSGDEKRDTLLKIGQAENKVTAEVQRIKGIISSIR